MSGDASQRIEDPRVAQTEGITINKIIDKKHPAYKPSKDNIIRNELTPDALAQSTNALTEQAKETVEMQYDERTGLPNYGLFREAMIGRLQEAISIGEDGKVKVDKEKLKHINFLIIDIGFLGYANDLFGTSCGDEYKVKSARVTERLSQDFSLRTGAFAIPYAMSHGDETAVVSDCAASELLVLGEKIASELSGLSINQDSHLPASAGIGIANGSDCIDDFLAFEMKTYSDHTEMYQRYLYVLENIADLGHQLDKNLQRALLYRELVLNPGKFGVIGASQSDDFLRIKGYMLKNSVQIGEKDLEAMVFNPPDDAHDHPTIVPVEIFTLRAKEFIKKVQKQRKDNDWKRASEPLGVFTVSQQLEMINKYI